MKLFIEIHALQNFVPSNLNRDDTGAPKDALFGGVRRARISSQCLKRAARQHFQSMLTQGRLGEHDIAVRTKRVLEQAIEALVLMGHPEEEARQKTIIALAALKLKIKDDGKSQYLLFLSKHEIQAFIQLIHDKWDELKALKADKNSQQDENISDGKDESNIKNNKKDKSKKKKEKQASPLSPVFMKIFDGGKAIDMALFGRMLTDMPEKSRDAACQVAHALSTHAVDREFDFYIAIDDLKPDDTAGADMMGTVEFNSACFYRYANVDFSKLVENLQDDEELAVIALKAFLEAFIVAIPTGKQNSFGAHNPPEFVAVTVCQEGAPHNLANAFEIAIRAKSGESLTRKSAEELVKKALVLRSAFGGNRKTFVLNLVKTDSAGFGAETASLTELLDKTIASLKG